MAGKFLLDDEMMENISGGTFKETDEIYEFVKQHDPAGYAKLIGELRGNFSAYFQSIGIEAGYINTRVNDSNVYAPTYDAQAIADGTLPTYSHEEIMAMLRQRFPG